MTEPDDVPYCADSCGRPATYERLDGMIGDCEVVELVCHEHRYGAAVSDAA